MEPIFKIFILLLAMIYAPIKRLTKIQNKIVFISRQSDVPSEDIKLLAQALKSKDPSLNPVVLCKTLKTSITGLMGYGFHMVRQMYHLATSKAAVLDSYCIAASLLKHKEGLRIFQMWHSMGSMKKFGYTAIGTSEGSPEKLARLMRMHANYDFVFGSADSYADDLAAGFGIEREKVVIRPLPRLDLLTDGEMQQSVRDKILGRYPELASKKNILYCPTFRKDSNDVPAHIARLADCVDSSKYNLIVKLHPIERKLLTDEGMFVSDEFSTFEFLSVADYVVSDYSCVVFEAAVLRIPIYFYAYDLNEYIENRGLAIDYLNECPGLISQDPCQIINEISSGRYDFERLARFRDKYVQPTAHAAQDMADFIIEQIEGDKD